ALVDGTGEIWWQAIEDIIARVEAIAVDTKGAIEHLDTRTTSEKQQAFDHLYWRMRKAPEVERLEILHAFADRHGYNLAAQCRSLIMDWEELRAFAGDPLCTTGAHTVHHYELAKLPLDQARAEMADSVDIIEACLGNRPVHFSYPLGGPLSAGQREFDLAREIGFESAVTTRPGGLYPRHLEQPHALPRISLNGYFQSRRYVDVFATGSVFSAIGKLTN
ncbi:MAG TPA: polysaccharide deacetylase family protein, partial [Devosia sp.]|nr:polysaccharide deacetylase family protein [Devosia sp.]